MSAQRIYGARVSIQIIFESYLDLVVDRRGGAVDAQIRSSVLTMSEIPNRHARKGKAIELDLRDCSVW